MGGGSVLRSTGRAVGMGAAKDVLSATAGAPSPAKPARILPMSSAAAPSSSTPPSVAASSLFVQATRCHTFEDGICSCLEDTVDGMPIASDTMQKDCSAAPELERIEHAPHLHMEHALQFNSLEAFKSQGGEKIFNAFDLLQSNPSVQRMVVSLSSDKAVWEAVMRNRAVQELKKSFSAGFQFTTFDDMLLGIGSPLVLSVPSDAYLVQYARKHSALVSFGSTEQQRFSGDPDIITKILGWILENTMTKIVDFIDKITKLVNELFHPGEREKDMEVFDDLLRSSFMLSVMVLIVVVVTRIQRA
ncbi:hypothetical protein COCNU_08G007130 [Cocos nucifera]|uniref:Uncharacterized protein n=1 Tax=Cocos nucifera TaxID=13894 RepID=A0A8K0IID7_COCNU|nr:hypothetical protein COCNU_08G007130 [Cocos nucifera]